MGIPLVLAAFGVGGGAGSLGMASFRMPRRYLTWMTLCWGLGWLAACLALVFGAKSVVIFGLARVAKLPAHPAQLAVGLGQVGDFGFVLATVAVARGVTRIRHACHTWRRAGRRRIPPVIFPASKARGPHWRTGARWHECAAIYSIVCIPIRSAVRGCHA